jgi:hypothetical protein
MGDGWDGVDLVVLLLWTRCRIHQDIDREEEEEEDRDGGLAGGKGGGPQFKQCGNDEKH